MLFGPYCVYIITNKHHTVLYIGVTGSLLKRIIQHKEKYYLGSFTAKYQVYKLVYVESYCTPREAIRREKQLKGGSRKKKIALIKGLNPEWVDLFEMG